MHVALPEWNGGSVVVLWELTIELKSIQRVNAAYKLYICEANNIHIRTVFPFI